MKYSAPAALRRAVRRELARRSLIDFTLYTYPRIDPDDEFSESQYHAGWFHRDIAERLDRFLARVILKQSPRMMLFAPPRSGKTEIVSRRFPASVLGRHPDLSIIATSYASELSSRNNRDVQRIIDSPEYEDVFPDTKLSSANVRTTAQGTWLRNSDIFEVVGRRGIYRSAGVMGGITGMGGHILIIDDPVKDAVEAESKVYRDRLWEWYTSTAYTRLAPGGGVLIILTRWHEDDLAGRLLEAQKEPGADQWEVVSYPAIAEQDEPHRKKGEPLHPERFGRPELERIRAAVGSRVWASLYQQRPAAAEGVIFKRTHWRTYRWPTESGEAPRDPAELARALEALGIRRVVQSWDTAFKAKDESDFSACVTMGEAPDAYYVLECVKRRYEFPELKRDAIARAALWRPHVLLVEDKASGQSLIQELKRDTRLPVIPVKIDVDKVARANAVTPLHEAGRFKVPEGLAWTIDFIDSLAAFPNNLHDDDVDAFTQAANYLARGGGGMGMYEWMRGEAEKAAQAKQAAAPERQMTG